MKNNTEKNKKLHDFCYIQKQFIFLTMFKFLIYLFLFYIVSRFVFGSLLSQKVKQSHKPNHNFNEPEGDISVKTNTNHKKQKGNSSNMGEYVDYEEIK